ncbi:hypothetical protein COCON_G00013220 [Conger conger]|uniref:Uncharacterized protein n=1 Tax=Conger conger TaxID=82655 RepID=A0A9Q1E2X9_CONCO|nr:hypothetical protein COCON_G00013220 [Conger conger]
MEQRDGSHGVRSGVEGRAAVRPGRQTSNEFEVQLTERVRVCLGLALCAAKTPDLDRLGQCRHSQRA